MVETVRTLRPDGGRTGGEFVGGTAPNLLRKTPEILARVANWEFNGFSGRGIHPKQEKGTVSVVSSRGRIFS